MKNSSRKSVFTGRKEVTDRHGEISTAVVLQSKRLDNNYIKLFLPEEGVYNMRPREMTLAAIHLFDYLCILAVGKDNIAVCTTADIVEHIQYSTAAIARAKDQLRKLDYIRQKANNIYMLNPEYVAKVDGDKRHAIFKAYHALKGPKKAPRQTG